MQIALCIITTIYALLSLAAACAQAKSERKPFPAAIMITGSALLIAAAICNIANLQIDFAPALLGCIAICAAAILNGLKSGQLHITHHIIRIAISLILIIGFALL